MFEEGGSKILNHLPPGQVQDIDDPAWQGMRIGKQGEEEMTRGSAGDAHALGQLSCDGGGAGGAGGEEQFRQRGRNCSGPGVLQEVGENLVEEAAVFGEKVTRQQGPLFEEGLEQVLDPDIVLSPARTESGRLIQKAVEFL